MAPALLALVAAAIAAAAAPAKMDAPVPDAAAKESAVAAPPAPVEKIEPATRELYDEALQAHAKGDRRKSAQLLFAWLRGSARTAEAYDAAQHLLADDLHALGLNHAALVYEAQVIRTRARPELLPEALQRMEAWTAAGPHDEDRFEGEVLRGADFGLVEGPARPFVAYQQGASDLKANGDRWAEARFAELPDGSPYKARARLLTAALKLGRGEQPQGPLAEFEEIAGDKESPREVRNEARISAARLRFEAGDFKAALAHYEAIDLPELDPGRGQLYLEQAWTRYRMGDGGRAMGLLAALEAPSFRALFLPEKYLLRALIYKDACHWLAAKRAARTLLRRWADSLQAVQERRALTAEPQLAEAAQQKGAGKKARELVEALVKERETLGRYASAWDGGLFQRLDELYSAEQAEAERRRQLELEKGVIRAADDLLRAAEQVSLVDYEVGLALYRRVRGSGPQSPLTFQDVAPGKAELAYGFDGEYWNDELFHYRFALPNRCAAGVQP